VAYCIEVHNIPHYHFQDFPSFSASMTKPPFPPFPNHSAGSICQWGGIRTFVAKSKPTRVETYLFFYRTAPKLFRTTSPSGQPGNCYQSASSLGTTALSLHFPHISHIILLISCHGNKKPRQHKTNQRNAA